VADGVVHFGINHEMRDFVHDRKRAHLKVCALKHAVRHEPGTVAMLRDRACRLDRSIA
jgi:hypothetical protein